MTSLIYLNSSNLLQLQNLTNVATGAYVNNATVSWTLSDYSGNQLESGTLAYVSSSNGCYNGTVAGSGLVVGTHYQVVINVNSGQKELYEDVVCVLDTGDDSC